MPVCKNFQTQINNFMPGTQWYRSDNKISWISLPILSGQQMKGKIEYYTHYAIFVLISFFSYYSCDVADLVTIQICIA